MDDLEPWNMFTNDYLPDDATDGAADVEGNEGDNSNTVPSALEDLQVKEEPEEHEEENFDEGAGDELSFDFTSSNQDDKEQNYGDGDDNGDNALFDFSEGGNSSPHNSRPSEPPYNPPPKQASSRSGCLSSEDDYYNNLIKYENAIIYICPACGEEFRSQELWKTHLNKIHQFATRRGLNFLQIDKLYHECQECHKRIAMHSMENLLKHKFTHLPFRCVKCDVCRRQYKYRQDLMIHLRMAHRDELISLAKEDHKRNQRYPTPNSTIRSILSKPSINVSNPTTLSSQLTIGHVKENATDIYDHSDNIEVRNEVLNDEDEDEVCSVTGPPPRKKAAIEVPSLIDDGSTTSGSANDQAPKLLSRSKETDEIDESLEEYVLFLCPQCGSECETQSQWRQHIEFIHGYGTRKGLNMRDINQGQAQCMECNQIISNNILQNLQAHKFNHLPRKQWMNCKLCFTSFNERREVAKHLSSKHHLHPEPKSVENNEDDSQGPFGFGGDDYDDGSSSVDPKNLLSDQISRREERDEFEQHIDYLCPQCGKEFADKKEWRKHIVKVHNLGEIESMNFEILNERQLRCKECDKIITNAYGIQNAQQHRITHMQYKSFAKCRICQKQYTDRKGLLKHLRGHGVGSRLGMVRPNEPSPLPNFGSSIGGNNYKVFGNTQTKSYRTAAFPQKEIVRHNNYTFEISFLEEGDDNSRGVSGNAVPYDFAKGDAHLYRKTYSNLKYSNLEPMSRHRCVDCGSSFPSSQVLQHHIRTEHDFVEFTKNSPKKITQSIEEKLNDADDLLVPSRTVDVRPDEEAASDECRFIYICPECGVEFRERHLWRRHINDEHNFDKRESLNFTTIDKFRFRCNTCHEVVQSSKLKGLQDHKFRHCPYRQYLRCLICGQAYNHKPNMISHLRQRHNIIYVEASKIPSNRDSTPKSSSTNSGKFYHDFATSRNAKGSEPATSSNSSRPTGLKTVEDVISFHNAVDHESITYHCPSCNDTFESHVYWRKHIVDEHNLNSREGLHFRQLDDHHYICLQCYKRVTVTHTKGAIGQLQSHKFRHLPYKSFRCTVCRGEFVRKQMFFKHLDKKTNKCPGPPQDFINTVDGIFNESQQQDDDEGVKRNPDNDNSYTETSTSATSSTKSGWPSRASLPAALSQNHTSEPPKENQECFSLCCPQCGVHFDTTRAWREHINIEHSLNNRAVLNFKKLNPKLHVCLECNEHVNGRKLRDLQVHKFKHLPHGAYLNCRFCTMKYFHISNMQEHLKNKHPNMLQKIKNFDEEDNPILDDDDDEDSRNLSTADYDDDDTRVGEGGGVSPPGLDMDLLEAEAEIEEVDPDNVESDEQYLLG